MKYHIEDGDSAEAVSQNVTAMISHGFDVYGPLLMSHKETKAGDSYLWYAQAMVMREDGDREIAGIPQPCGS